MLNYLYNETIIVQHYINNVKENYKNIKIITDL